jgi:phage gpG-like protein
MADNNFNKLARKADDFNRLLTRLPRLIGTEAVNFSKKRFREQAFVDTGTEPWKKRKPGANRNRGRNILADSGKLKNSIRITKVGKDFVTIGSKIPYAQIHNEGGTINIPVTDKMRKWGWAMFAKTNQSKFKGLALTKKTSLRVRIPKRQFMGNSFFLRKKTTRMMVARFNNVLKS